MKRYAIFHDSGIHHTLRDAGQTTCSVIVVASGRFDSYQSGRPLPKIVDRPPRGSKLCKNCAAGGHVKGPRNPKGISWMCN
jgi:hypothetical protein